MPRTCLACASPEGAAIDKALANGTPLREITGKYGVKHSSLDRHKKHTAEIITKIQDKREEKLGENLLNKMRRVQEKAWELLGKMKEQGDYRGAVLASREARECLLSANELLARAEALKAGSGGEMLVKIVHIGAQ